MNKFAFLTTGFALKKLYDFSKAKVRLHGVENIPEGSCVFVANHFTRSEAVFLPHHIEELTKLPVWSLGDASLFSGALGEFLDKAGGVSTSHPHRDLLMVKSLLAGEANWIIYPEGSMIKNKKIYEDGKFLISSSTGKHSPHTGAATLALRTEFYRQRLQRLRNNPDEVQRLMELYQLESLGPVVGGRTFVVPVNITYSPMYSRKNLLSTLAANMIDDIPDRMVEELMTEGTMFLSGVDVDIRFGKGIAVDRYLSDPSIQADILSDQRIDFDDPIGSRKKMRGIAVELMEEYMTAIYSMTTVNHDHLFASLLSKIPYNYLNAYDLKCRVFLAATEALDSTAYNAHDSLRRNQVHLLTDDRFEKYRKFLSVAFKSGVIEVNDRIMLMDRISERGLKLMNAFDKDTDFHRIRVRNPIFVMANEIEPLEALQEKIGRLAKEPPLEVKRRIAAYLIRRASVEFDTDYEKYQIEGESLPREVGRPYLVKGREARIGIVLVHGYMAAPMEVRELADYFGELGYWVYVPRLKGHGTAPEDLAGRNYMEWVESVEEGYVIMKNICDKVFVGGFSTGAGLALDLVTRVNDVAGAFAVAPPMKLHDISSKLVPAVDTWNKLMEKVRLGGAKKEFIENQPENPHINYRRNPIAGIRELERLMDALAPKLPEIKLPVLLVQSRLDPVVDPKGSRMVFDRLGSEDKEYFIFNFDRHGILLGDGAARVHRAIGDFVSLYS